MNFLYKYMETPRKINLILPLSLKRGDYMVMILKVASTTAILLNILRGIYLLMTGNQYRSLFKSQ